MPTYEVRLWETTSYSVEVYAEDEELAAEEAIEIWHKHGGDGLHKLGADIDAAGVARVDRYSLNYDED